MKRALQPVVTLLALLTVAAFGCDSQEATDTEDASALFPAVIEPEAVQGFGYINRAGEVVIPERFEWAGLFDDGYANVIVDGQNRVIDRRGNLVESSGTGDKAVVEAWLGGCFALRDEETQKLSFWCADNGARTQFIYDDYRGRFADQRLAVVRDGHFGYLNRTLEVAIALQFDRVREFSNGFAAVSVDGEWGWIGPSGDWLTTRKFDGVGSFGTDDVAPAEDDGQHYLVDSQGTIVPVLGIQRIRHFSEGLAAAQPDGDERYGYIGPDGTFQIAPRFSRAGEFNEGLAAVRMYDQTRDGHFGNIDGYIDRGGEMVIVMEQTGNLGPFINGLARVAVGDRHGHINRQGEWVSYTSEADSSKRRIPAPGAPD